MLTTMSWQALAKRAIGFSMRIVYHNRNPLAAEALVLPATKTSRAFDLGPFVEYIPSLDELLAQSDVVSLNLPLNAKTQGSFGRKQFAKMKKGAVLVNTARGGVVDEEAMIEALESGQVRTRRRRGFCRS